MIISKDTLNVLRNFATINSNVLIQPGNVIKTVSEGKNVLAEAEVAESFPVAIALYDLNDFLAASSLIDDADFNFKEKSVVIKNSSTSVEYFYSNPELLTTPPKSVTMPSAEVSLVLTSAVLSKLKKAASVLGHSQVSISGKNGKVSLIVADITNSTANKYTILLSDDNDCKEKFNFIVTIGNLKMLDGDYTLDISSKKIAHLKHTQHKLQYWLALEKDSTYGND